MRIGFAGALRSALLLAALPPLTTASPSWLPGLAAQAATRILDEGLVPSGRLRLGVQPVFSSWDSRYGIRVEGGVETREIEPLASELAHERGAIFPGFDDLEGYLRALADDPEFIASAGVADATLHQDVTRVEIGAHFGVFEWLTVGVRLPLVKERMAFENSLRTGEGSGANLGINPALGGNASVDRFLDDLADAAADASSRAANLCAPDPGSASCLEAWALSDRVATFGSAARGAYASSYVFPMRGTGISEAIAATLAQLDSELRAARLGGIRPMVFATEWFSAAQVAALPSSASVGADPIEAVDGTWRLGDVEANLLARVVHGAVGDTAAPTLTYHLTAGLTGRFGTGAPDSPHRLYDLGSGDGQIDIEARAIAQVRLRGRVGVRAGARYGLQQSVAREIRIAPPESIFADLSTLGTVTWTPAPYIGFDAEPGWIVTDELSVVGAYRFFSKGTDSFALGAEEPGAGPLDPANLERESGAAWHRAGLGLRYSTSDPLADGTATPLDLHIRMLFPIGGSGGHVPVATSLEVGMSIFRG